MPGLSLYVLGRFDIEIVGWNSVLGLRTSFLRVYPMGFVRQLFKVFTHESAQKSKGHLRNKNLTNPTMTDLELFQSMPLSDAWEDAGVASVYFYLRRNRYLVVPDSWEATIQAFDRELDEHEAWTNQARFALVCLQKKPNPDLA